MERARNWCVEVERQARGRDGCSVRYVVAVSDYIPSSDKCQSCVKTLSTPCF